MFNTFYLLTTLNISIQTMDCHNLQNSYVLRILCFGGEGDWLDARGGVRNISSPLRGVLNIFRHFWEGAKFYGRILEYGTHTLWPVPKWTKLSYGGSKIFEWVLGLGGEKKFFDPSPKNLAKKMFLLSAPLAINNDRSLIYMQRY
jgi:hypothetical protein